jgi:hypothetical protein
MGPKPFGISKRNTRRRNGSKAISITCDNRCSLHKIGNAKPG